MCARVCVSGGWDPEPTRDRLQRANAVSKSAPPSDDSASVSGFPTLRGHDGHGRVRVRMSRRAATREVTRGPTAGRSAVQVQGRAGPETSSPGRGRASECVAGLGGSGVSGLIRDERRGGRARGRQHGHILFCLRFVLKLFRLHSHCHRKKGKDSNRATDAGAHSRSGMAWSPHIESFTCGRGTPFQASQTRPSESVPA